MSPNGEILYNLSEGFEMKSLGASSVIFGFEAILVDLQ
jgi:hypothetical protein